MKNITDTKDIKAVVKTDWSHPNHKFKPAAFAQVVPYIIRNDRLNHDKTKVIVGHSYESKVKQRRVGQIGEVVAVSCLDTGHVRNNGSHHTSRMYTRYYLKFTDGNILGFHSHHLTAPTEY